MIAPLPMASGGLAGFPGPRAARLRRVASFGLLWRPLCGVRLCACGSLRLCDRLLGVCVLPRPFWLLRCVCGSLRLSFLRSSAWGSSLPPLRSGKELNLKLLVYARPAFGHFRARASSADKVKLLSPHDRFVIALHSPDRVVETGLLVCPPEKKGCKSLPAAMSRTLSPVRFERKRCGIAPISRNFKSNPGGFLCTSDCVAEGEGFELSVRFLEPRKGPHVRDL